MISVTCWTRKFLKQRKNIFSFFFPNLSFLFFSALGGRWHVCFLSTHIWAVSAASSLCFCYFVPITSWLSSSISSQTGPVGLLLGLCLPPAGCSTASQTWKVLTGGIQAIHVVLLPINQNENQKSQALTNVTTGFKNRYVYPIYVFTPNFPIL